MKSKKLGHSKQPIRNLNNNTVGWFMGWTGNDYARINTRSDGTGDSYLLLSEEVRVLGLSEQTELGLN